MQVNPNQISLLGTSFCLFLFTTPDEADCCNNKYQSENNKHHPVEVCSDKLDSEALEGSVIAASRVAVEVVEGSLIITLVKISVTETDIGEPVVCVTAEYLFPGTLCLVVKTLVKEVDSLLKAVMLFLRESTT